MCVCVCVCVCVFTDTYASIYIHTILVTWIHKPDVARMSLARKGTLLDSQHLSYAEEQCVVTSFLQLSLASWSCPEASRIAESAPFRLKRFVKKSEYCARYWAAQETIVGMSPQCTCF